MIDVNNDTELEALKVFTTQTQLAGLAGSRSYIPPKYRDWFNGLYCIKCYNTLFRGENNECLPCYYKSMKKA